MYGYRIENGEILTVPEEEKIIRKMFRSYLQGMSYAATAKSVGISICHSSVKTILTRKEYIGIDGYPAIIDEDTFNKVNAVILLKKVQNPRTGRKTRRVPEIKTDFRIDNPSSDLSDPAECAEYIYSLIQG